MDYIDYRSFTKKLWLNDRRSHKARLELISTSPSTRIDNKLGKFYRKAPCRNKQKNTKKVLGLLNAHQSSLKTIQKRSASREIVDRIQNITGLSTLTKKFRSIDKDQNRVVTLNKVKSSLSMKAWEKAYEQQQVYKRQISKPHLHDKPLLCSYNSPIKRSLLEVPFISF